MHYGPCLYKYECGAEIHTVVMGGGNVAVSSTATARDGVVSVVFGEYNGSLDVGGTIAKESTDQVLKNAYMQLMFDNSESIDVVIAALERSKAILLEGK